MARKRRMTSKKKGIRMYKNGGNKYKKGQVSDKETITNLEQGGVRATW